MPTSEYFKNGQIEPFLSGALLTGKIESTLNVLELVRSTKRLLRCFSFLLLYLKDGAEFALKCCFGTGVISVSDLSFPPY